MGRVTVSYSCGYIWPHVRNINDRKFVYDFGVYDKKILIENCLDDERFLPRNKTYITDMYINDRVLS